MPPRKKELVRRSDDCVQFFTLSLCSIFMALGLPLIMMMTDFFLILIASMSVKEVLQSLVDDNLVDTDKIGTSIYFWAYPSKALHTVSKLQSKTSQ